MHTIHLNKINKSEFKKAYLKLSKEREQDEKTEVLFNSEGKFTGHNWKSNCFYTESDLIRNGDYKPDQSIIEFVLDFTLYN